MKALNTLSGLDVGFVSLVRRAAVRDPSNPSEPMRFALTKSEVPVVDLTKDASTNPKRKPSKKRGRRKDDQERDQMAKKSQKTIGKVDADRIGSDGFDAEIREGFESSVAEIRRADPTVSEYDAHVQALRKADDVRRLQDAYLEAVNPTAAIAKAAIAKAASAPGVGAEAAVALKKAAAEVKRSGMSDYDAMVEALHRDPELGRYREVA